ncbi:DUF2235 domain-containing protein [Rhodobacteraceae bacterium MYP1-1]|uniref:DUF2235 domain-containing protein n=2 Tax=Halocynthiibacter styelae TaxID=2761955 RepID=A0A8J7ICI2_9RHOB|nr:DUF2235 domain-containing protein [Paenihalocynthiibacter styelae]MBI1493363.1 DUF2235 domain-containing protein [Paenihalocynthiibacter styelae]
MIGSQMRLLRHISDWFRPSAWRSEAPAVARRGAVNHVVILDGTMSSLHPECHTNAAITYKLMQERAPASDMTLFYGAGVQWKSWRDTPDVIRGRGINRQIRAAYGHLASKYRPGDKIFLFGYSRGAFAVRSLAGVIDRIGLLRASEATERNIRQAYRHYECSPGSEMAKTFARLHCHEKPAEIEMIGVWDTVKALGFRAPLIWRFVPDAYEFHNHTLGASVRHGYQALALDETRQAFAPVLWDTPGDWQGNVEQMWFKGAHGDIGGQLGGREDSRGLSNIPLIWVLDRAEALGLQFPEGWRSRFPRDADAPAVGSCRGWGMLFLNRRRRLVGRDVSEVLHDTVVGHKPAARILRADLAEQILGETSEVRTSDGPRIRDVLPPEHGKTLTPGE